MLFSLIDVGVTFDRILFVAVRQTNKLPKWFYRSWSKETLRSSTGDCDIEQRILVILSHLQAFYGPIICVLDDADGINPDVSNANTPSKLERV
jgi:hypothetical protein